MAIFDKELNHLDLQDAAGSLRTLENYISYMRERLEFNNSNLTRTLSSAGTSTAEMVLIVAALQNRDIPVNGSGEQMRTFCWVEDMVDGLVRMMEATPSEQTRTLDLGSNHEISIRALAEKIISLTGSRSRIVHRAARPDDARRRIPDISAARRELDWTPRTPLAEGLRRTISYAEKELTDKVYTELTWAEMN
mgnify:CR=1 FL=1